MGKEKVPSDCGRVILALANVGASRGKLAPKHLPALAAYWSSGRMQKSNL